MISKNKLKLSVFLVYVILFLQIFLISSQQDFIDIGQIVLGLEDGIIIGWGVEYGKGEDGILIEFAKEGAFLDIRGNRFENIVPNTKERAYLELDKEGKILQAEFTVNKTWNYTFRNNKIVEIPAGMKIYYDIETGLEFRPTEGFDLSSLPNLLDYFKKGYINSIKGENIVVSEDLTLRRGKIRLVENGFLVEEGRASYKKNYLAVDEEKEQILIADLNADLSDYKGNWIRQTGETLKD